MKISWCTLRALTRKEVSYNVGIVVVIMKRIKMHDVHAVIGIFVGPVFGGTQQDLHFSIA